MIKECLAYDYHFLFQGDFGGAKCPKFNLVGELEMDNLALANMIAKAAGKELKYKLVDFHSSRPGHDLRLIEIHNGLIKTVLLLYLDTPSPVISSKLLVGPQSSRLSREFSSSQSGSKTTLSGQTWLI